MSAPSIPELLVARWVFSAAATVALLASAGAYVWLTHRVRSRWPARATLSFLTGLVLIAVALESGIEALDDRLLSVHMAQHMFLLLLAPLALLGGQPVLLLLRAAPAGKRPRIARALARARGITGPVTCAAVFYAVVLLTHLPAFYDAALRHPLLHQAEHLSYLAAGLLVWWPILDCDPAPTRRLGGLGRIVYVLAAMPAMALVGAYLNRHMTVAYPLYAAPARALGVSAVADQQQAGALMWVAGNSIMVAVGLWAAIAALVAEERRLQAREAREAIT